MSAIVILTIVSIYSIMSIRQLKQKQVALAERRLTEGNVHLAGKHIEHAIRYDRRLMAQSHIDKARDANNCGSAIVACAELEQALKLIRLAENPSENKGVLHEKHL